MSELVEKTFLFMLHKFMVSKKFNELSIHRKTKMTLFDFVNFVVSNSIWQTTAAQKSITRTHTMFSTIENTEIEQMVRFGFQVGHCAVKTENSRVSLYFFVNSTNFHPHVAFIDIIMWVREILSPQTRTQTKHEHKPIGFASRLV